MEDNTTSYPRTFSIGRRKIDGGLEIPTQRCSHNNGACRYQQQLKNAHCQMLNSNKEVDRTLELIQGHKAQDLTRPKRALISGVGKDSRCLFGTLNEASEAEIKSH